MPLRQHESVQRQFVDTIPISDESMIALDSTGGETTPVPQQEGIGASYEHIGMDDVQEEPVYSQSQNPSSSQAVRQPLKSRVAALAEQDPDGHMQSFELVYPLHNAGGNKGEAANAKVNGKRKGRDDEGMNGSDSSPTPEPEIQAEEEEDDSGSSPAGATRGGRGRGAKKSRAATDGVKKTRARGRGGAADGHTPRPRTRAAAKANGDVDM